MSVMHIGMRCTASKIRCRSWKKYTCRYALGAPTHASKTYTHRSTNERKRQPAGIRMSKNEMRRWARKRGNSSFPRLAANRGSTAVSNPILTIDPDTLIRTAKCRSRAWLDFVCRGSPVAATSRPRKGRTCPEPSCSAGADTHRVVRGDGRDG